MNGCVNRFLLDFFVKMNKSCLIKCYHLICNNVVNIKRLNILKMWNKQIDSTENIYVQKWKFCYIESEKCIRY